MMQNTNIKKTTIFKTIATFTCIVFLFTTTSCASAVKQETKTLSQSENQIAKVPSDNELSQPETELTESENELSQSDNELSQLENEVSILMVGDVLLHDKVSESGQKPDGTYQYNHLFAQVKSEVSEADIAIVNQEVILGGTELGLSGYPSFNGAFEVGDAIVDAGFDVVLHATNHALDKGEKGVRNCLDFWQTKYPDIKILGIHNSEESKKQLCIIEKNGIKIAILNKTFSTNGISVPKDAPYLVDYLDKQTLKSEIENAEKNADFTVVCVHWGTEYQTEPDDNQVQMAQFMADEGVDLVLGTHPHVIEPVEWVTGVNGTKTLVYYSLGNFINATSGTGDKTSDRMLGAMATITLQKTTEHSDITTETGEIAKTAAETAETAETAAENSVIITEYGAIPVVSHVKSGYGQMTSYKLSEYTEVLAKENEILLQDPSFSKEYCTDLWEKVFPDFHKQQ